MFLKMKRSQMTSIGHLMAGVAYDFTGKSAEHQKVAKRLLEKKFAVKTTAEAVQKEAEDLAERQRADLAAGADGRQVAPSMTEMAEQAAQKVLEDAAEKARDDAAAIIDAAKKEAEGIVAAAKATAGKAEGKAK